MRIATLVLAALTASCTHAGQEIEQRIAIRALRPPQDMICADGKPVRLLTDATCRLGICGWSCAPDRWRDP